MKGKDCTECHKKFAEKYDGLKFTHGAVKQRRCEDCHLRHGIVPKLALKQAGNNLCFSCHKREAVGMDKPNVHPVLKSGKCTQCHDPHGTNAPHLLKAEGKQACFGCHKPEPFQRKLVHKVVETEGCRACHVAHASDQKALLTADQTRLCGKCHDPGKGNFKKAHGDYPVGGKTCTTCQ